MSSSVFVPVVADRGLLGAHRGSGVRVAADGRLARLSRSNEAEGLFITATPRDRRASPSVVRSAAAPRFAFEAFLPSAPAETPPLAAVDSGGAVFLFDVARNRYTKLTSTGLCPTALHVSPWETNGYRGLFVAAIDGTVHVYDVATDAAARPCTLRAIMRGHAQPVVVVRAHPTRHEVLTASVDLVAVWDGDSLVRTRTLDIGALRLRDVNWTPDGEQLVVCFEDSNIFVWTDTELTRTFTLVEVPKWQIEAGDPLAMAFPNPDPVFHAFAVSPDMRYLVGGGSSQSVCVWDFARGSVVRVMRLPVALSVGTKSPRGTQALAFLHDSRTVLVLADNGRLYAVDITDARVAFVIGGGRKKPTIAAFHAHNNLLAARTVDGEIHLYDIRRFRTAWAAKRKSRKTLESVLLADEDDGESSARASSDDESESGEAERSIAASQPFSRLATSASTFLSPRRHSLGRRANFGAHASPATWTTRQPTPGKVRGGQMGDLSSSFAWDATRQVAEGMAYDVLNSTLNSTVGPMDSSGLGARPFDEMQPGASFGEWQSDPAHAPRLDAARLSRDTIRDVLDIDGRLPDAQRLLVWKWLLQLPDNRHVYAHVAGDCELHPAVPSDFSHNDRLPRADSRLGVKLRRQLSGLARWSTLFEHVSYLPELVFPFVRAVRKFEVSCFEIITTYLFNHVVDFFEDYPAPPRRYLQAVEAILTHCEPDMARHFHKHAIGPESYAWPLLRSSFTTVVPEHDDWLALYDRLIFEPPFWLLFATVSVVVAHGDTLVQLVDGRDVEIYYESRHEPMDVGHVLARAAAYAEETPVSVFDPADVVDSLIVVQLGTSIVPLPPDALPVPTHRYPSRLNVPRAELERREAEARAERERIEQRRLAAERELALSEQRVAEEAARAKQLRREQRRAEREQRRAEQERRDSARLRLAAELEAVDAEAREAADLARLARLRAEEERIISRLSASRHNLSAAVDVSYGPSRVPDARFARGGVAWTASPGRPRTKSPVRTRMANAATSAVSRGLPVLGHSPPRRARDPADELPSHLADGRAAPSPDDWHAYRPDRSLEETIQMHEANRRELERIVRDSVTRWR